jgi:predicted ester cyclase
MQAPVTSPRKVGEDENLRLMQTLDDAWNSQDWGTFGKRHAENVKVSWPGGASATLGRDAHRAECQEFFRTFPDNHIQNRPYKVAVAQGDHTCTVADFTGSMKGSLRGPDGRDLPATNRPFRIEFCTVATWKNGEITEERLFYDLPGMMQQIGLG